MLKPEGWSLIGERLMSVGLRSRIEERQSIGWLLHVAMPLGGRLGRVDREWEPIEARSALWGRGAVALLKHLLPRDGDGRPLEGRACDKAALLGLAPCALLEGKVRIELDEAGFLGLGLLQGTLTTEGEGRPLRLVLHIL